MPYRRKNSPFWWVKYTDASGRIVAISTKSTDLEEAKAYEAKCRHEVHQQRLWGIKPKHTWDAMMLAYFEAKQGEWRDSGRQAFVAKNLHPFFTGRCAEEIRRSDVAEYISKRKADGKMPATINRELALLSAAFNFVRNVLEWDLMNPVTGLKLKAPEGRLRWIRREEADRLIAEAERAKGSPHLADFIRLALNTGCRRDELLTLSWQQVDFAIERISLEGENTKSGKRRSVPLSAEALQALANLKAFQGIHCPGTPWVFAHEDGSRVQHMKRGFASACERAGIKDFHVHDMRHTCASWLVSAGVPLIEVRNLLGHASIEMTERYSHLAPENLSRISGVLNQLQSGYTAASGVARLSDNTL